jgi:hypothetical protein
MKLCHIGDSIVKEPHSNELVLIKKNGDQINFQLINCCPAVP